MTKIIDIFLIAALAINLFNTYRNYEPALEIFGTSIPTWVAVVIQVVCIIILALKVWRSYAANK